MTLELLDTRFNRAGYPKTVEYTESDYPRYWKKHWQNKESYNSEYYKLQTSKKFTYTLNSQGYREKEWKDIDWSNSYVFLGCSHTFGVGVPNDETLPKQVQSATGVYCVNLGIPGGNNMLSVLNSALLIQQGIRPKGIFYQHTYTNRWFDYKEFLIPFNIQQSEYTDFFKKYSGMIDFIDEHIPSIVKSQWTNICDVIDYKMEMIDDHHNAKYIARCGTHYNGLYFEKIVEKLLR